MPYWMLNSVPFIWYFWVLFLGCYFGGQKVCMSARKCDREQEEKMSVE